MRDASCREKQTEFSCQTFPRGIGHCHVLEPGTWSGPGCKIPVCHGGSPGHTTRRTEEHSTDFDTTRVDCAPFGTQARRRRDLRLCGRARRLVSNRGEAIVRTCARTGWVNLEGAAAMIKDPQEAACIGRRLAGIDTSAGAGALPRLANRPCCCCSAPATLTVIVTSKVGVRRSVDVVMCERHYRQCASALSRLTPLVFDRDGYLVASAARR